MGTMRPMRPSPWIVTLVALVLLTAGCSADDPDPGPGPATASSSPTPAETTETPEPAGTAALQACDLLGPADYRRFIRPALRASASEGHGLDGDLGSVNTCAVSSGPFGMFQFGYSTDPDARSSRTIMTAR